MDESIRVPGTKFRFGLDPLLGLVPVGGDTVSLALSLYIVAEAWRAGVPKLTLARMLTNVAFDALFGAVPVVGDAIDAVWKANERNRRLLQRSLEAKARAGEGT
jgi:hypothetical protein